MLYDIVCGLCMACSLPGDLKISLSSYQIRLAPIPIPGHEFGVRLSSLSSQLLVLQNCQISKGKLLDSSVEVVANKFKFLFY